MRIRCIACLFCHTPLPGHMIGAGSGTGLSPGQLEAARELMQLESEQRDAEDRRVDQNYRFDYEPKFHAWCERFTPTEEEVHKAAQSLIQGDERPVLSLEEQGKHVIIDAVNGKVRRVYELCLRKNSDGKCGEFSAR